MSVPPSIYPLESLSQTRAEWRGPPRSRIQPSPTHALLYPLLLLDSRSSTRLARVFSYTFLCHRPNRSSWHILSDPSPDTLCHTGSSTTAGYDPEPCTLLPIQSGDRSRSALTHHTVSRAATLDPSLWGGLSYSTSCDQHEKKNKCVWKNPRNPITVQISPRHLVSEQNLSGSAHECAPVSSFERKILVRRGIHHSS